MHKYMALRGNGILIRRVIEDIKDIYYKYVNKKTGKTIGMLQVMPREIKSWECVFPATAKKEIKEIVRIKAKDKVSVHFGPFKKDKFFNGVEFL